jgi:hypothetical protein
MSGEPRAAQSRDASRLYGIMIHVSIKILGNLELL